MWVVLGVMLALLSLLLGCRFYDDVEAVAYGFLLHLVGRRQRPNFRVSERHPRIPTPVKVFLPHFLPHGA